MRWGVSDRATAAIVNAALLDFGVITGQDVSCVVDRQKVRRAKLMCRTQLNLDRSSNALEGLYFDGKEIDTLYVENNEGHNKNVFQNQEHTVLISEPGGKYLGHLTTDDKKAVTICNAILEYLGKTDSIPEVKVLGADSTSTNTGVNGGIIRLFEDERGMKVHWAICLLHTNELPLRHLIDKVDGPTSGNQTFKGPIGKTLMKVGEWDWNNKFRSIRKAPSLPEFSDEVFNSLSSDQKYLYLSAASIRSGKIDSRLRHLQPGPVCHSRWLTTACRLMTMYMKKHPFNGQVKKNLYTIVYFIVTNYVPCWFSIKTRPLISDASHHVLLAVELLRLLPKATHTIVAPFVKSWHAHPENLLVTLLCCEHADHRSFAVEQILKLRNGNEFGDTSPRAFHPPRLNFKAKTLMDLISWKEVRVTESILTCHLSIAELEALRDTPLAPPKFPSHTQAVERMVRELTNFCRLVAGSDARDGYIRARLASRAQYSKATTKRDFTRMVSNRDDN